MTELETIGNGGGNTKSPPRIVPSKRWCFTFNNYSRIELETLETLFKNKNCLYIFGLEVGTSGTPHLQGYIESKTKIRPVETFGFKNIHWEKSKGTKEENILYCSKSGQIHTNMPIKKKLIDPMEGLQLYEWQNNILEIISHTPEKRKIHWFWSLEGCTGKSTFAKHLVMNNGAYVVCGKGADIKFALAKAMEERDIEIIVWDIPRDVGNTISYATLEEVKNGLMFSTKFESGQVIFNIPHIIVFANKEPVLSKLSEDRWDVRKLEGGLVQKPTHVGPHFGHCRTPLASLTMYDINKNLDENLIILSDDD